MRVAYMYNSGRLFDVPMFMYTCLRQMVLANVVAVTIFAMLKRYSISRTSEKSSDWQLQTEITSGTKKFSDYRDITTSNWLKGRRMRISWKTYWTRWAYATERMEYVPYFLCVGPVQLMAFNFIILNPAQWNWIHWIWEQIKSHFKLSIHVKLTDYVIWKMCRDLEYVSSEFASLTSNHSITDKNIDFHSEKHSPRTIP